MLLTTDYEFCGGKIHITIGQSCSSLTWSLCKYTFMLNNNMSSLRGRIGEQLHRINWITDRLTRGGGGTAYISE